MLIQSVQCVDRGEPLGWVDMARTSVWGVSCTERASGGWDHSTRKGPPGDTGAENCQGSRLLWEVESELDLQAGCGLERQPSRRECSQVRKLPCRQTSRWQSAIRLREGSREPAWFLRSHQWLWNTFFDIRELICPVQKHGNLAVYPWLTVT